MDSFSSSFSFFLRRASHNACDDRVQEHLVTEKKEEQPAAINAFEIISMSRGLNLENLFDPEQVCVFVHDFIPIKKTGILVFVIC